jgi:antitoxin component of RelBE/YafQ-DinJ toxin-antitoxin module
MADKWCTLSDMPAEDTRITTRLSPRIKLAAERQARRDELSLSDVVRMLLKAYAKGDIDVEIRVGRKR